MPRSIDLDVWCVCREEFERCDVLRGEVSDEGFDASPEGFGKFLRREDQAAGAHEVRPFDTVWIQRDGEREQVDSCQRIIVHGAPGSWGGLSASAILAP
ncbi:MAG: hypothetical protein UY76_C0066G0006 [Candidatus Uhrbacteria bacterium GW2011_GWA2_52_8d]|uniref:Uncharacterized protein n=1 Tax=Candidatus Uhrbacteria bacterium GW2011_GWA2_52_8d TaxID=1618979 RepID=A0A0G1XIN0_9BACT|nr:MAG: hypothetical protein UY76_C0066G0006 [Candidatus Uhrbacteria bacterium GW2011_GWA2_52_8d]